MPDNLLSLIVLLVVLFVVALVLQHFIRRG